MLLFDTITPCRSLPTPQTLKSQRKTYVDAIMMVHFQFARLRVADRNPVYPRSGRDLNNVWYRVDICKYGNGTLEASSLRFLQE